ncbi:unnamed protein product [Effrenium voratum]|uniref:TPM domain-containing protein n=1 Tax=Effrenium voratum TaxID=2562239 RepID=A0AA36JB63_9DINO|nr:unnamed protein product [Effrenium voratum]CAJ1423742.1 unnamed protein product [Effrenium voratum]
MGGSRRALAVAMALLGLMQACYVSGRSKPVQAWPRRTLCLTTGISIWQSPAWAQSAEQQMIVDDTNLLAPSTEKSLDRILRKLQADTGLKLRVVCPPTGIQDNRDEFRAYLKPISKTLGADTSSVVLVAEERFEKRFGRPLPLMTLQAGFRLQERFQYRLTNDFLLAVADKFGFPGTVSQIGSDLAIERATKNVAAALFALSEDPKSSFLQPLSDDLVASTLQRHGV